SGGGLRGGANLHVACKAGGQAVEQQSLLPDDVHFLPDIAESTAGQTSSSARLNLLPPASCSLSPVVSRQRRLTGAVDLQLVGAAENFDLAAGERHPAASDRSRLAGDLQRGVGPRAAAGP